MASHSRQPSRAVSLSSLVKALPGGGFQATPDVMVTGIAIDSRKVQAGNLFVALGGTITDGHLYIPQAIERGASVIVGTRALSGLSVPYLQVEDSRLALAYLAAAFYDYPARELTMIGITGTDGKTTTCNLLYHIFQTAGLRVGMISTVSAMIGEQALDTGFHVTTPEAPEVQAYLRQMVAANLTHVILEATSHGLAQHRVAACEFDMAVVTNITHEHLDYHGSYQAYRQAKGRLFASLSETRAKSHRPPRGAALNWDDSSFAYLTDITVVPKLSYGLSSEADVSCREKDLDRLTQVDGLRFTAVGCELNGKGFCLPIFSPLIGSYNVHNCLAAIALSKGIMGLDDRAIQQGLAAFPGVPGRMERIDLGQDFTAIVDFAHTPNALRRALETARQLTKGRVIAVFGSAGLRDRQKRWMMAETSAELADLTILTAEDPRSESLKEILAEMAAGMERRGAEEGKTFWRCPDRREAIRSAVRIANNGDLVIACGKGHEQSMCFGEVEYPWDDRVAMRAALAELLGVEGPQMPYLPPWE